MDGETVHHKASEEPEHGESMIPHTEVSISDLEEAMAEFLSSPRSKAAPTNKAAPLSTSTKKQTRKSKRERMKDVFSDDAFMGTETNGTETFSSRRKGYDNFEDEVEDADLREYCRRTLGPSLDKCIERNFGIDLSDPAFEETEEDQFLREFSRRTLGPSLNKCMERNLGIDLSFPPKRPSSKKNGASKQARSEKKKNTQAFSKLSGRKEARDDGEGF